MTADYSTPVPLVTVELHGLCGRLSTPSIYGTKHTRLDPTQLRVLALDCLRVADEVEHARLTNGVTNGN